MLALLQEPKTEGQTLKPASPLTTFLYILRSKRLQSHQKSRSGSDLRSCSFGCSVLPLKSTGKIEFHRAREKQSRDLLRSAVIPIGAPGGSTGGRTHAFGSYLETAGVENVFLSFFTPQTVQIQYLQPPSGSESPVTLCAHLGVPAVDDILRAAPQWAPRGAWKRVGTSEEAQRSGLHQPRSSPAPGVNTSRP